MKALPLIPRASQFGTILDRALAMSIEGRVRAIRGTTIVAGGLPTPVGSLVQVIRRQSEVLDAEVIALTDRQPC